MSDDMNIETEDLTSEAENDQNNPPNNSTSLNQKTHNNERNLRGCRQSRSRENDRHNRNKRNNDRSSHWDNNDRMRRMRPVLPFMGGQFFGGRPLRGPNMGVPPIVPPPGFNMGMISGMNSMMQFPQIMPNVMGQQSIDGSQPVMPNMNMHCMMNNMMDQNMIIMNQTIYSQINQPIVFSWGVLLPPIPGVSTPQRKEKPNGCRTVFIGGLPVIDFEILKEIFEKYGPIDNIKSPKSALYYIRFEKMESVESSFSLTGYRFKFNEQSDNEATTIFVDYALNRDDADEYEMQCQRVPTPPLVEPFSPSALSELGEKIKSETDFVTAAPTLAAWLQGGECNKLNANTFYSLIQASNNQVRRLFNEKMNLDEELNNMKTSIKDKFALVVLQFELVAKILSAAKDQRVSDHFSKQQRRNIEMWLKMTEEVENIKEEFYASFDDDDVDLKLGKNMVPIEKYEELKKENENLSYELEEYKNEVHLAKDEAERKFEKFKAHFIAQQALQNNQIYPHQMTSISPTSATSNPPLIDKKKVVATDTSVPSSEAMLISILTAFLLVHPLGASLDYLVSYVKSMISNITQSTVLSTLKKYENIFHCSTTGVGACIEHKWTFISFDTIKKNK
ncbi:unnamed protein product, partial [Brenthis ino]